MADPNVHRNLNSLVVIPAKAGTQGPEAAALALDPRFRGDDE